MGEKLGVLGEIGFWNFWRKNGGKEGSGGRRWCDGGGGNDGWWWVWCLEVPGRREMEMEEEKKCTVLGGRGRNSDLKIGYVRVQLECVRTYIYAFDRTRAECMCVKWALRSNVQGKFERIRA
jgi:hypothetical protein